MAKNDVEIRLQHIISEIVRINQSQDGVSKLVLNEDCDLREDLGLDSLLMVQLIVEVENEFDLEFDLADLNMEVLRKYQNLRNYIISHHR